MEALITLEFRALSVHEPVHARGVLSPLRVKVTHPGRALQPPGGGAPDFPSPVRLAFG